MLMKGLTFQPVVLSICMSGLCLVVFFFVFFCCGLCLVNSLKCITYGGVGVRGVGCLWGRLERIVCPV
jgi:hypothetical protein